MTRPEKPVAPAHGRAAQAVTHGSVSVADLTHAEVSDRLSDHIDGTLPDAERRRVDSHLASCHACATDRATLKATVTATDRLPHPKAPAGSRARILDAVRREMGSENGQ